jgi:hypothetical protein
LAGALADLADGLPGAAHEPLDVADRLAGALPKTADRLSGALAHVAHGLSGALAHVADGLTRALADVPDRLAGSLANVLQSALRALSELLHRIAGLTDSLTGALADLRDRAAQPFDELGVAVEARHEAVHDGSHVIEPRLQDRLHLDALEVEEDTAQMHVEPDVELHEVEDVRLDRQVGVEVVELEVDRVDAQLRNIEEDIGLPARLALLTALPAPELALAQVVTLAGPLGRSRSVAAAPAA